LLGTEKERAKILKSLKREHSKSGGWKRCSTQNGCIKKVVSPIKMEKGEKEDEYSSREESLKMGDFALSAEIGRES